ncbi:SH2 domain-containing protein 7-like isoform X2 [Nerophis ophidion]|uniref:SH2 domain-containing protein 7-like isoform X2 n=1 Tax=Nerophis ophidion TaxID=159077 RepID=UPI002AE05B68|nr:SH2 domain-containing protein 7-like isoform X2 [Nerophis ophidion]XP_061772908.1 SH2 domain-containing protein 7-like isoform X2 [Nerophis ophidion]
MSSGSSSGEKETSKLETFLHFSLFRTLRTCWRSRFKDSERTEQSERPTRDRSLMELSSKWFIETQVAHFASNGFFPAWFGGFITRENAEVMLKEKEHGSFLIRLSDRVIGYILSYRGRDRCRHFAISQSKSGHFIVSGDTKGHGTVLELIQHYKNNPIQPFREYLTSSCFETPSDMVYDVIQHMSPPGKTGERAHTSGCLPPMSQRTLEDVPPVPRRDKDLMAGSPVSQRDKGLYAKIRKQPTRALQGIHHHVPRRFQGSPRKCRPLSAPDTVYSMVSGSDEPHDSPRTTRHLPPERTDPGRQSPKTLSTDRLSDCAAYFLAGTPGSPHAACIDPTSHALNLHSVYTNNNTYEAIPGIAETFGFKPNCNTYESL